MVEQLSVFLENETGGVADVVDVLRRAEEDLVGEPDHLVVRGPLGHGAVRLAVVNVDGRVAPGEERRLVDGRIERRVEVDALGVESAGRPDRELLVHLREAWRAAADRWLRASALVRLPAADARLA